MDESESMLTPDINTSNNAAETRLSFAHSIIEDSQITDLEENASLTFQFFSSGQGKNRTNLHDPIMKGLENSKNLKAIVIISDGDLNMGPPPSSLVNPLLNASIATYSIFTGSTKALPDIALEGIQSPSFTLKEEKLVVGWRIKNKFDSTKKTTLSLHANEKVVKKIPIQIEGSSWEYGNISWLPPKTGKYQMELKVERINEETFFQNNQRSFKFEVKPKVIKVLLVESSPRWEYRFLRNALLRDPGVELKCILYHPQLQQATGRDYLDSIPQNRAEIDHYDVIFIGDVGLAEDEMNEKECNLLAEQVNDRGSGIVFIPGRRGRQLTLENSQLAELQPIIFDQNYPLGLGTKNQSQIELTERGAKHWLTQLKGANEPDREFWSRLPGFHWSAIVEMSRPGTQVLATHSNFSSKWGKMPILATRYTGSGKALFLGTDSAWRWRRGVEDKYHYRFWSQVVRWMAHSRYQAVESGIRILVEPEKPSEGEEIFLRCIASNNTVFALESGNMNGFAVHSDGTREILSFHSDPESPGVFQTSLTAKNAGPLTLEISEVEQEQTLSTQLEISEVNYEKKGLPVVTAPLSNLSKLTNGKAVSNHDWTQILPGLKSSTEAEIITNIFRLRASVSWGLFLFVLLAIYWTGRKLLGMV